MLLLLPVAILILAIVIVVGIGFILPVRHEASLEMSFHMPASELYRSVRGFGEYPTWRRDVKSVQVVSEKEFQETDPHGRQIRYGIQSESPGRFLSTKILNTDLPFGGGWDYEFTEKGRETVLRITEHGEVYNPIFRFVSRFIFGHTRTMEIYVADLKKKVEK